MREGEVAKPLSDFREGQAVELLVRRVMPTCRIDGDEAITPVTCRQNQAPHIERRWGQLACATQKAYSRRMWRPLP